MKNQSLAARLILVIRMHPLIALCGIAMGITTAAVSLYTAKKLYESRAVIEHQSSGARQGLFSLFASNSTSATEEITSIDFVTNAIQNKVSNISYYLTQDFRTQFNTYAFPYEVNFKVIGNHFQEQSYVIHQLDDENFALRSNVYGIERSKQGKFGETLTDRELSLTINKKKTRPYQTEALIQPGSYSFKIQSPRAMASELLSENNLSATEQNGVLTISCRNESRDRAKHIAEAVTSHFMNTRNSFVATEAGGTTAMDEQLVKLSALLHKTESQIADYKKKNNITEINFDTEKSLAILQELQLQKTELELTQATLNNTSKYLRKNRSGNNSTVEYGAISDPVFSEQLSQLNSKYESKAKGTGAANIDIEIEALKTLIAERILNTRKKNAIQLNKINHEIAIMNQHLATLPEKANTLSAMNRKLVLDQKVYDMLAEKRAMALISGSGSLSNQKLLNPASVPTAPVSPISWLILAMGALGGLLAAVVFSLIFERINSAKISKRQQLDEQTRIPFIGTISTINDTTKVVNQSIANLCTRVLMQPETKIITFVSTNRGDGKTFIATHFAQAFAAMDKKVLVLDMNYDNPGVSEYFGVSPERTLADVLSGSCDIHDAISLTAYPNLDILECGEMNAGVNSLLASDKQKSIFDDLKKHYDLIVTDTPELGTKIDAVPMMNLSGLNLMVIRANTTRKTSLVAAEQIKKDYNISNLFFLLNTVNATLRKSNTTTRKSRIRTLTKQKNDTQKPSYVPEVLRKIALWFY